MYTKSGFKNLYAERRNSQSKHIIIGFVYSQSLSGPTRSSTLAQLYSDELSRDIQCLVPQPFFYI